MPILDMAANWTRGHPEHSSGDSIVMSRLQNSALMCIYGHATLIHWCIITTNIVDILALPAQKSYIVLPYYHIENKPTDHLSII
jgi:hypothetical protein